MIRRKFIKQAASATGLICLGEYSIQAMSLNLDTESILKKDSKKHITVLHTNDLHSHIEPFPSNDPNYANMGGAARRAAVIKNIRQSQPNVLLLDAGDIFQGTPYFNFYGGELDFKLLSMMGYDAATIGNHDFDNGVDGLAAQMPHATFSMLNANYNFSNTLMDGLTKPYEIFIREGVRIGVFGLGIKLEGLVTPKLFKETVYLDPVEIATDMVDTLKNKKYCDIIICLSHLGYDYSDKTLISDRSLAQQTQGIDLIIGGHTHTFLEKPAIVQNKAGTFTLVNQVGWGGINLGRIDFYLDHLKNLEATSLILDI